MRLYEHMLLSVYACESAQHSSRYLDLLCCVVGDLLSIHKSIHLLQISWNWLKVPTSWMWKPKHAFTQKHSLVVYERFLTSYICPQSLQLNVASRHPDKIFRPPQLTLFHAKEQYLYFQTTLKVWVLYTLHSITLYISLGKRRHRLTNTQHC